jgi:RIO kinase 1
MSNKQLLGMLDTFIEDELITDVLQVVKSGKEATVFCCRAHPATGYERLAAKVYRPREQRGFKNDAVYHEGRVILDSRVRRAVANKSRFGRESQFSMWLGHEFGVLNALHAAGADVPRPVACAESAILMEYLGDASGPAPHLQSVELERGEAGPLFERIMENVALWLGCGYVHADLSPFNILYLDGAVKIIDFPQAVDPRFNRNALGLLTHDIGAVCEYFWEYGVRADPARIARQMWARCVGAGNGVGVGAGT